MLTAHRVPVNRVQALLKLARQVLDEQHGPDPGPVSVVIVRANWSPSAATRPPNKPSSPRHRRPRTSARYSGASCRP